MDCTFWGWTHVFAMFRQSQAVVVFSASSFHSWKAFKASLISWEETSTSNASKHHSLKAIWVFSHPPKHKKWIEMTWGSWGLVKALHTKAFTRRGGHGVSFEMSLRNCTTGAGNHISNSVICWPTRDILRVLSNFCPQNVGFGCPMGKETYWTNKPIRMTMKCLSMKPCNYEPQMTRHEPWKNLLRVLSIILVV